MVLELVEARPRRVRRDLEGMHDTGAVGGEDLEPTIGVADDAWRTGDGPHDSQWAQPLPDSKVCQSSVVPSGPHMQNAS